MEDPPYDSAMRLWLIANGAIAILENDGLRIPVLLRKHAEAEAFNVITVALYWLRDEAQHLIASAAKKEAPEHLPQHSGNTSQ